MCSRCVGQVNTWSLESSREALVEQQQRVVLEEDGRIALQWNAVYVLQVAMEAAQA